MKEEKNHQRYGSIDQKNKLVMHFEWQEDLGIT